MKIFKRKEWWLIGLDNGIVIKRIAREQIGLIPPYIECDTAEYDNEIRIEIAYWRKCWGIRNEIINILHMNSNQYKTEIDVEDIPAIIRMLYKFLSEEYWSKYGDSIWEYEDIKEKLVQNIINLKWLYYFMQKNENIEVEFYDSY